MTPLIYKVIAWLTLPATIMWLHQVFQSLARTIPPPVKNTYWRRWFYEAVQDYARNGDRAGLTREKEEQKA